MKTTRDYLIHYIGLGFHPIPLIGKVPCCKWKDFTLTNGNMSAFKNRNWGLRTDQIRDNVFFYVVDLDSRDIISDFWEANTIPEHTPIVATGRGFHFYFTWTEPVKTIHFSGIDVIGNGAYVVAPPSLHPNGKYYQFLTPLETLPPLMNPEKLIMPQQLVIKEPVHLAQEIIEKAVKGTLNWRYVENGAPKGMRNTTLFKLTCVLIKMCLREEEALSETLTWNKLNRPPLPEDEVIRTVRYCYKKWG